jgi:hypothetical protein
MKKGLNGVVYTFAILTSPKYLSSVYSIVFGSSLPLSVFFISLSSIESPIVYHKQTTLPTTGKYRKIQYVTSEKSSTWIFLTFRHLTPLTPNFFECLKKAIQLISNLIRLVVNIYNISIIIFIIKMLEINILN